MKPTVLLSVIPSRVKGADGVLRPYILTAQFIVDEDGKILQSRQRATPMADWFQNVLPALEQAYSSAGDEASNSLAEVYALIKHLSEVK